MQKSFKSVIFQAFFFMGLLFVLNLSLRAVFILCFKDGVNGVNLGEFALFFYNAFRYDGQIIGVMSVVFFFLALLPKEKIVKIYAFLVIFISTFVSVANIGFYGIYQDVFNASLLGLIYDDRKAIFETALGADYGLTYKVLLWLVVSVLFYALWAFFHAQIAKIQGKKFRISLFVAFAFLKSTDKSGLKAFRLAKKSCLCQTPFCAKSRKARLGTCFMCI